MEKEIRDKILNIMKNNGISYGELSRRTKLSKSTLQRYMTKKDVKVPIDRLKIIAEGLNTTPSYLMGWNNAEDEIKKQLMIEEFSDENIPQQYDDLLLFQYQLNNSKKIPIIDDPVCCGDGIYAEDINTEYFTIPNDMINPSKDYFAQYASGDSMIDAHINNGDLLVFEKTNYIENGQIGCFAIDENMAVCKKFYKSNGIIMLQSANDEYDPIIINENSYFRVVGVLKLKINKS